jgi:nitrogen fixation/metabolism regulation signal transduction histidine kinase
MDKGKIRVRETRSRLNETQGSPEGGDPCVILEMADTGVRSRKIWMFFTTKPEGTGLSLPIVEQIVSEHHGTADYITEAGKSTVFIVSLPLCFRN